MTDTTKFSFEQYSFHILIHSNMGLFFDGIYNEDWLPIIDKYEIIFFLHILAKLYVKFDFWHTSIILRRGTFVPKFYISYQKFQNFLRIFLKIGKILNKMRGLLRS